METGKRTRWRYWTGALVVGMVTCLLAPRSSGLLVDMAGHWASSMVAALEAAGIVSGTLDGRFQPEAPLTRAQLAKLLVTGLGYQEEAALLARYPSRFDDVPGYHWAKGYIEALVETGIAEGYDEATFAPSDLVTRAQMAVFLVRAAGLEREAQQMRHATTRYTDDRQIPAWARGAVQVAAARGLMAGFPDGSFRPSGFITRAEGSAALIRLLGQKGRLFHLSGTLVQFDPVSLQGVIRDELGQERSFVMAKDAQFYRGGFQVTAPAIQPLDQVWVVMDADGVGRFLEARYADLLGSAVRVRDAQLTVALPDGNQRLVRVQSGALIFLNGRPAALPEVDGAAKVYLVLDRMTGEARVVDAVKPSIEGRFESFDGDKTLYVSTESGIQGLPLAPDAIVIRSGRQVEPADLQDGERLLVVLNGQGQVTYLQVDQ